MKSVYVNLIAVVVLSASTNASASLNAEAAQKLKCTFDASPGKYWVIKFATPPMPGDDVNPNVYPVTLYMSDKPGKDLHETVSVQNWCTRLNCSVVYQIQLGSGETLSISDETTGDDYSSYGPSFTGTITTGNVQTNLTCK
jgi:hypothetical protein